MKKKEIKKKKAKRNRSLPFFLLLVLFLSVSWATAYSDNSYADTINLGNASVISSVLNSEQVQLKKSNKLLTKKKIFESPLSQYVVNKEILKTVTPVGGALQALSLAPGIMIRGYNPNVGASRAQESVRGFNAGWNSATPDLNTNKLTNLFDGIPMDNLDGEWRSSALPLASMIQGINVIYGPGNPGTRWFDSIGGTINTIPIQPTAKPGADVSFSVGSYNAYTESVDLRTGLIDGWSTVIAGSNTISNDFRGGGSGDFLAKGQSLYVKTVKTLAHGWISFGGYAVDAFEKRPNFIPVNPTQGITFTGSGLPGPYYSQATSGFYSALPYDMKGKEIHVNQHYLYSQLELNFSSNLTFNNEIWYKFGHDSHYMVQDYFNPVGSENNGFGASETFGDKAVFDLNVPYNDIKFGGYYIHEKWPQLSYAPSINNSDPLDFSADFNYYQYLSAFLQDTVRPVKNLAVTPGVNFISYDEQYFNDACGYWLQNDPNFTADCEASQDGDPYDPNSQNPGDLNAHYRTQAIEPSIGFNYRVLPYLALYGDWAVLYQNPDNASFMYNDQGVGSTYNGVLVPIQTYDGEFGGKFMVHHYGYLNDFVFNVNYYQDDMSRQTLQYNVPSTQIYYYAFASEFYKGYNIYLSDNPVKNLHVFANLNLQHNVYTSFKGVDGPSFNGYPVSNSPDENFNVNVSYKVPYMGYVFTPEITDQFVGKQYLYSNNLLSSYSQPTPYAPTHMTEPGFNIVNFNLNVKTDVFNKFIPGVKSGDLNFNMYNVFDKQFNVIEYYSAGGVFGETPATNLGDLLAEPGMPRAFYVTLSLHFGAPHE